MSENKRTYTLVPFMGKELIVADVLPAWLPSYRFSDPGLVPIQSQYCDTPVPADQENVTLVPGSMVPETGLIIVAGVCANAGLAAASEAIVSTVIAKTKAK